MPADAGRAPESPASDEHPLVRVREFLKQQACYGLTRLPASQAIPPPARVREVAVLEAFPEQATAGPGPRPADAAETGGDATEALAAFHASIAGCTACRLSAHRRVVVFGSGNPNADVMFVGEAPGAEEDRQGVPFVGEAGQLLTKMIEAIHLRREDVYIANVIKCRPPGNRDPEPDEIASCQGYLRRQIELVRPVIICALGRFAAQLLLGSTESMGRLRGRVFDYAGIKLVPTYHPSALLHNSKWKRPAYEDLKLLRREYDGMIV